MLDWPILRFRFHRDATVLVEVRRGKPEAPETRDCRVRSAAGGASRCIGVRPNAELTGRRRRGALAARQMMNHTATRPG